MRERTRHPILRLAALAGLAAVLLAGCGEKDEPDLGSLPPAPDAPATTTPTDPATVPEEPEPQEPATDRLAREAEQTVQAYFTWIDRAQGSRLCTLIDEDALEQLRLPVERGGCGRSLSLSIGHRNPRGLPVFESVELREVATRVRPRSARVVATVSVRFADRPRASVEDDVIYLERAAGNWIVAKPSATLYRAIGAEIPPSGVAPPRD